MATGTVTITMTVEDDQLGPALERLERAATFFAEAADDVARGVPEAFERGDANWTPLAPWTQQERTELGYGAAHPILIRTGAYLASFRGVSDDDGFGVASDDPRFETLNTGGVTETGHAVPARPVDIADEFMKAAIDRLFERIIQGKS